jgi:hypothetical protein
MSRSICLSTRKVIHESALLLPMIPKKIHYAWFGVAPLPLQARRCLASWAYHLPDYEFMRWDESNFDPHSHPFTSAAYKAGAFAFVSDYVRMLALSKGGIYLDVDVEVYASFNGLLDADLFIGLEAPQRFATSIIGVKADHWLPEAMLTYYGNTGFDKSNLKYLVNINEVSRLLMVRGFTGSGGNEQLENERILEIGMFADARHQAGKSIQPLARHLYVASWRNKNNKNMLSRTWRKIKKLPSQIEAWVSLQSYRIRKALFRK